MTMLCVQVPSRISQLLVDLGTRFPGTKEPAEELHTTILYLGDNTTLAQTWEAVEATYKVTQKLKPFKVSPKRVISFPPGEDDVHPIVVEVESPALHKVWADSKKEFDKAEVEYSKKFPTYRPHITLSYSEGVGLKEPYNIPNASELEFEVTELVLWGGDSSKYPQMKVILPLGRELTKMSRIVKASRLLGE